MEWEALNENQGTFPALKAHFFEAYEDQLHSGLGKVAQHGYHRYHGEANATKEDDDSLISIDNSIVHIQMANSAKTNILNETINELLEEK